MYVQFTNRTNLQMSCFGNNNYKLAMCAGTKSWNGLLFQRSTFVGILDVSSKSAVGREHEEGLHYVSRGEGSLREALGS